MTTTATENSIYGERALDVEIALLRGSWEWWTFGEPTPTRLLLTAPLAKEYGLAERLLVGPLAPDWARELPRHSTDNNLAMVLFAELPGASLYCPTPFEQGWGCYIPFGPYRADTAALAICAAWLAWKRRQ